VVISAWPWCIFPYNLVQISLSSAELLTFFRNSRWRPQSSWIFTLCEFGHTSVYIVWYLCSVPNFVQISVVVTEMLHAEMHRCFRHSFDDITRINLWFRFFVTWSFPHRHDASSRIIWCTYLYPVWSYWHFSGMPSWIFSLYQFGHSGVLVVWYLCFLPNLVQILVIVTETDTYASDIYLMTSHKLTSSFDFWSCAHLRMAVVLLPV